MVLMSKRAEATILTLIALLTTAAVGYAVVTDVTGASSFSKPQCDADFQCIQGDKDGPCPSGFECQCREGNGDDDDKDDGDDDEADDETAIESVCENIKGCDPTRECKRTAAVDRDTCKKNCGRSNTCKRTCDRTYTTAASICDPTDQCKRTAAKDRDSCKKTCGRNNACKRTCDTNYRTAYDACKRFREGICAQQACAAPGAVIGPYTDDDACQVAADTACCSGVGDCFEDAGVPFIRCPLPCSPPGTILGPYADDDACQIAAETVCCTGIGDCFEDAGVPFIRC